MSCIGNALEVLGPASDDGGIVNDDGLSIRTAYGCVDLVGWPIH